MVKKIKYQHSGGKVTQAVYPDDVEFINKTFPGRNFGESLKLAMRVFRKLDADAADQADLIAAGLKGK